MSGNSTASAILSLAFSLAVSGCSVVDAVFNPPDAIQAGPVYTEPVEPIDANRFVLPEDADVIGELQVLEVRYEDTFVEIARTYGLGYDELVAANPGVDPWIPGEGTRVVLPTRFVLPVAAREGVVLNVAAKRLFYFPEPAPGEPRTVETWPIGIGRVGWSTPTGDTTIVSKARDPVWFVPASIRREHEEAGDPLPAQVPPGPDNPLGNRVLALGIPGYLIHGTNKPAGVGMRVSHGCVRMFPEDIEYLYELVDKGTRVRIVNQPYLFGWDGDDMLLEAHAPLDEDDREWSDSLNGLAKSAMVNRKYLSGSLDVAKLNEIEAEHRGFPVSVLNGRPDAAGAIRQARWVTNDIEHETVVAETAALDQD